MRKIFEDIFTKNYPSIDLHGFDRDSARVAINDFVNENYKLQHKNLVIIHGVGTGIIRNTTHETLKNNSYVEEYRLHNFNLGMTIVKLK